MLDKHARFSQQMVGNHNSPWIESIRDETLRQRRKTSCKEKIDKHEVYEGLVLDLYYFQGLVQAGKTLGFTTLAHS